MSLRSVVCAAMLVTPGFAQPKCRCRLCSRHRRLAGCTSEPALGKLVTERTSDQYCGDRLNGGISSNLGMVGVARLATRCRMACVSNSKAIFGTIQSTQRTILASLP